MYYLNTNLVMFISKIPSTNNLNGPLEGTALNTRKKGKLHGQQSMSVTHQPIRLYRA